MAGDSSNQIKKKPTLNFVLDMKQQGLQLHIRDLQKDLQIIEEKIIAAEEWITQCENLFLPKIDNNLLKPFELYDVIIPCYTFIHNKAKDNSVDDQARWVKYPRSVCGLIQVFKGMNVKGWGLEKNNLSVKICRHFKNSKMKINILVISWYVSEILDTG